MSEIKHTPGHWFVQGTATVRYEDDRGLGGIICSLSKQDGDERLHNARLIAAAPDLLRALKWATNNLAMHEEGDEEPSEAIAFARAAIAKAEGRS